MPSAISGPRLFAAAAALVLAVVVWAAVVNSTPTARSPAIRVLAIGPSGRGLAAGTSDGFIFFCDSVNLKNCRTFEADGSLNDMRFSHSGELVIADRNIRLTKPDQDTPTLIRGDGANYGAVRFVSGRRSILTIDGKGNVMTVDLDTGRASLAYCCSSIWGDVEFSDQGNRAIWAGHWPGIWDLPSGRLVGRLTLHRESMTFGPIAIDRPNGLVYMGSQDGQVYRWNIESRQLLSKSPPLPGYVMTISVLGKSGWIAYASQPGVVHLWNPHAGVHQVVAAARASSNIAYDQQRDLAALGTGSGAIEFWDLPRERLVETRIVGHSR
ncbi:MAG: hypothetical protein SFV51_08950 [Bryobacteraceae bacterium]|nr:hypothetical protein [Bryobacteraceae bacterium]